MQNRDGGWAAFDVDIDNEVADQGPVRRPQRDARPELRRHHGAGARVLGALGYRADHPAVAAALDYLWRTQEPEGCWYGRWGVNYIYGTWQVLAGPQAHRLPDGPLRRPTAADWLESVQQAGGGWGETCGSYDEPVAEGPGRADRLADRLGRARPDRRRASRSRAVRAGIDYLPAIAEARRHLGRGRFTGTGFPGSST